MTRQNVQKPFDIEINHFFKSSIFSSPTTKLKGIVSIFEVLDLAQPLKDILLSIHQIQIKSTNKRQ